MTDARNRPDQASEPGPTSHESPEERIDRELIELLNELRVALPGIQVLFAFLLTLPFSGRFGALEDWQRQVYFVAFLCTALASTFLMFPTAYHRVQWRRGDKERMLRTANRLALAGMVLLAIAIGFAVFLTGDVLFGSPTAWVFAALIGVALAWTWFAIPLMRRAQGPRDSRAAGSSLPS